MKKKKNTYNNYSKDYKFGIKRFSKQEIHIYIYIFGRRRRRRRRPGGQDGIVGTCEAPQLRSSSFLMILPSITNSFSVFNTLPPLAPNADSLRYSRSRLPAGADRLRRCFAATSSAALRTCDPTRLAAADKLFGFIELILNFGEV
ncbi:LOW QUALITY PROTEIN: hypothetical protein TorRG33x02_329720 [Trema orientale]|uniref:Uncharacterized protein n=1 Tax=Trema orientale TaxID=63057 RepID=A0A2P5B893_TREOI|nr:LOW QUALITY PROTEIN: hypothetical protein TorRG33x02_329720 [Trema orientale]